MPRGNWGRRKEPVTDDWIMAAIAKSGGKHHPQTGHYGTLTVRCDSAEEATEFRRSLFRCAHYLSRTGQAAVSVFMTPVRRAGGKFLFDFTAVDKSCARAHHLGKHGADRSKWPYDPLRRITPDALLPRLRHFPRVRGPGPGPRGPPGRDRPDQRRA